MNATHPELQNADTRREVDRWIGNYSEDHRNPTNILIHWICVPLIVWSVVAALWTIPVPAAIGRPGLWAGVAMFASLVFYLRLSKPLAFGMLAIYVVMGLIAETLFRSLGHGGLLLVAGIVFVLAWIAQFIGHNIEGRRPAFMTDLVYLLIGPTWIVAKLFRKLGVPY
jgi:uncharacterized membrane protein YGL010W